MLEDARVNQYVQRITSRLGGESSRPGLRYQVRILDSDEINSFPVPGGFVFITRGLLEALKDEDELAAVLAHEIGHIGAFQFARKVRKDQFAGLGFLFLGPALGGGIQAVSTRAAGRSGVRGLFMRFTNGDELEADRIAVKNLYDCNYNPQALWGFYGRLNALAEQHPGLVDTYLKSHSNLDVRRDAIAELIDSLPSKTFPQPRTSQFAAMSSRLRTITPRPSLGTSEAIRAILETDADFPETAEQRELNVAAAFAPNLYQALGESPRYDYITNFDFDGDMRGDNNWDHAAKPEFPLKAWVYYAVQETRSHWFIHYAVFHPRDYKAGTTKGPMLSKLIRLGVDRGSSFDPTGRAREAVLAHENDLEGVLVVVEKHGPDPSRGKVVLAETLAHNTFLKFRVDSTGDDALLLKGHRPEFFIEARGHGILAYDASVEQRTSGKNGIKLYTYTGHAEGPYPKSKAAGIQDPKEPTGYNLAPIRSVFWPAARRGITATFAETEDYGVMFAWLDQGGQTVECEMRLGRLGSAFRGPKGGGHLARPPWAWFDGRNRNRPLGEWYFDPAAVIRRDFSLGEEFSVAYLARPDRD
jgi:hypothetical protein